MTKLWNPTTQLIPLNNYPSNCVITSSYSIVTKNNLMIMDVNIILNSKTNEIFLNAM